MVHPVLGVPQVLPQVVEGLQREVPAVLPSQIPPRVQVRDRVHRVPVRVHGPVHERRGTLRPRSRELLDPALQEGADPVLRPSRLLRDVGDRLVREQDVLGGIVVHLPALPDVVPQRERGGLLRRARIPHLLQRPREVVPVVPGADVRILARIEAAGFLIAQDLVRPSDDPFRRLLEQRVLEQGPRLRVVRQEGGVVVRHLLEVRDDPHRVRGVPVEPARDLVVHPSPGHPREGAGDHVPEALLLRAVVPGEEELHRPRVRELRGAPEPAVHGVELPLQAVHRLLQEGLVHVHLVDVMPAALREGLVEALRGVDRVRPLLRVVVGDREEDPPEARAAVQVLRREVRASVEHLPVRRQECGEGPPALSADRVHRGLVPGVHVGPLIAIDLHRHEPLVDDLRDFPVLVRLVVDHVAPVAPHRPDVEEDRPVLRLRLRERVLSPRVPVHGLVGRTLEVRGGFLREAVLGLGHCPSSLL